MGPVRATSPNNTYSALMDVPPTPIVQREEQKWSWSQREEERIPLFPSSSLPLFLSPFQSLSRSLSLSLSFSLCSTKGKKCYPSMSKFMLRVYVSQSGGSNDKCGWYTNCLQCSKSNQCINEPSTLINVEQTRITEWTFREQALLEITLRAHRTQMLSDTPKDKSAIAFFALISQWWGSKITEATYCKHSDTTKQHDIATIFNEHEWPQPITNQPNYGHDNNVGTQQEPRKQTAWM